MPYASTTAGTKIYYEETGAGHPILFAHEFAADHREWETQVRFFSRRYRCIAYDAPGYGQSDVPDDGTAYDYRHQVAAMVAVLRHCAIAKAHIVGLSMGAFSALQFGVHHPGMASALVVAGCGSGAPREHRERFRADCEAAAARIERDGMKKVAPDLALGPTRVQLQNKDRRGWEETARHLAEHPTKGSAMTLRHFQAARPSLWDFEAQFRAMDVPVLLIVGDEDEPCLEANLFLKRAIPRAGLWVVPKSGHPVNLEEPAAFNDAVSSFLHAVEAGAWPKRDPRATAESSLSMAPVKQE
jgi:pimeloyl-ACP methyl ester carboxylesterase